MRIGFDIDGVLAEFIPAYQTLWIKHSGGVDLFHPNDVLDPPCWDWPQFRGYSPDLMKPVWDEIKSDPTFWLNLQPERSGACGTLATMLKTLERNHEVYFITSRSGIRVKRQTEIWLYDHLVYPMRAPGVYPSVLIVGHRVKGQVAKALNLDAYIDDNFDNVHDCATQSSGTRTYLLCRAYNRGAEISGVIRVNTLGEMFDNEIRLGNL